MELTTLVNKLLSLSARRAWIEIGNNSSMLCNVESLSARRAWIEIRRFRAIQHPKIESLSARRAWIEIRNAETLSGSVCVALRKESVDRN